ncbi:flagellar basal body P-ring protein FlgI [Sphingomicrobium astaxanthinifaciens]|uniref:flagellar basal body P-ring protein FlgI n=1 Tax=Sphingomicrobium astaxanthinifaciens TaxID=1227949 RepID=UPI001FCC1824|nr:flagellar basal body P-ring protein FlgI [Sphingomicrobium astaxanthinifaciens]MCJ7420376.1 flagellar basal body P-ring protein FlgI [Sphingomicrobium astaxanthinifaciens]
MKLANPFWFLALLSLVFWSPPASAERVRDLGSFETSRSNQLTGYGIVVGLDGTGDDNFAYLTQAMRGVSGRLGLQLPPGVNPALKNAAAVIITADLPAYAKRGQRIDVTVSTMGKAKSLRGGALILTPLYGADGQIYAMAQGNLAVGGLGVSGADGSKLTVNVPTVGRISDGASVEREVGNDFAASPILNWNLHRADFLTASRVRDAINAKFSGVAQVVDGVTLALRLPPGADQRADLIAAIDMIEVAPAESSAKIIVNSRTGTVVISSAVRLAPAAISHGSLVVRIDENPAIVQPEPFSDGETALEPSSSISVGQGMGSIGLMEGGASLAEVVDALNQLGASPADLVAILEALKQAGSLTAEMVIL